MDTIQIYAKLQKLLRAINNDADIKGIIDYIDNNELFYDKEESLSTLRLIASVAFANPNITNLENISKIITNYSDIEIDPNSADTSFSNYNITSRYVFIDFFKILFREKKEETITKFIQHFTQTNPFLNLINEDNVELLQIIISQSNINLDDNLTLLDFQFYYELKDTKPLNYAAFRGSVNCFKYLLLNTRNINYEHLLECAIAGSNYEIIHIVEDEINYEIIKDNINLLNIAILYMRNELIDYIIENYGVKINSENYINCIYSSNYEALLKLVEIDDSNCINDYGIIGYTPIGIAASEGYLDFFIFMLKNKKVNYKKLKSYGKKNILDVAKKRCRPAIVNYIVEKHLINCNTRLYYY